MSLREVSDRMGVSYRHAKRPKHGLARDEPGGLIHGNTGRRPGNAIDVDSRQKRVGLSRRQYGSLQTPSFCNPTYGTKAALITLPSAPSFIAFSISSSLNLSDISLSKGYLFFVLTMKSRTLGITHGL